METSHHTLPRAPGAGTNRGSNVGVSNVGVSNVGVSNVRARIVRAVAALLAVISLVGPSLAEAQITNVASLAGKPVEDGFTGSYAAGLDLRTGNVELVLASASTTNYLKIGPSIFLATASAGYGIKGDWDEDPFQAKVFEHIRYRYDLSNLLGFEAFAQHEYDRLRRLALRAVAGAGVRLDSDIGKRVHVAFGLAFMEQWEELTDVGAGDAVGVVLEHRLSSYLALAASLSESASLALTCYVQPRVDAFTDTRGLLDATLITAITRSLSLQFVLGMAWDTDPPAGVRGLNTTTRLAFAYSL